MSGNIIPSLSSCMYSTIWTQKDCCCTSLWTNTSMQSDFHSNQITAPESSPDASSSSSSPTIVKLTERNEKGFKKCRTYKHVLHKDKPAQVVARRNARERKRVEAVNSAFVKLRKAVPVENSRGKRISKVKTLQYAIDYIQNLEKLLQQNETFQPFQTHYYTYKNEEFLDNFLY